MIALWLCLLPIAWVLISKVIFHKDISVTEMAWSIGIPCVAIIVVVLFATLGKTIDIEIRNGQITEKYSKRVSCSHSYPCRCRQVCSGTGKNRSCYQKCDTCYRHSYDVSWIAESTVGDFYINRIDSQGLKEPPRWSKVEVGEPASKEYSFTNYIKASPNSLFNFKADGSMPVPNYVSVYDYYRINRIVNLSKYSIPDLHVFNEKLNLMLRELGPAKQVNIIVIITDFDRKYKNHLESAWLGAKKNDVVIIYGIDSNRQITWADSFSFAKSVGNHEFHIMLRNELEAVLDFQDLNQHTSIISNLLSKKFVRVQMSDFEYLKEEIMPSDAVLWILVIVLTIFLIAATIFNVKNEL